MASIEDRLARPETLLLDGGTPRSIIRWIDDRGLDTE